MRASEILNENVVDDLFQRNGGQVMRFEQLPVSAQKAIHHYMVVDGDSPDYADQLLFGYALIPTKQLKDAIWSAEFHENDLQYHGTFAKYHQWYWGIENPEEYRDHLVEMWPIILDDDEIIQDGWHRFHYYITQRLKLIPAIRIIVNDA